MPSAEREITLGPDAILIALPALLMEGPATPMAATDAVTALERLAWIARPVVLAGEQAADRRLPADPDERARWVRETLGGADLAVIAVDDPVDRLSEELAVGRWREIRSAWHARWLMTTVGGDIGPARRAGLTVVRVGPREIAGTPSVERADLEARDLLDAVNQLLTADAFAPVPAPATPD